MGNITSHTSAQKNVFEEELAVVNGIVTNLIKENDTFYNDDYNFLSKDVCKSYQVLIEDELNKHLKIDIKSLGTALYVIPKNDNEKLGNLKMTKKELCEKISNHYLKILYILTLVKYVYSIETHGDLSIAGIIFRNVRVLDDIMEINFCDIPHKTFTSQGEEVLKIDFSMLEGFKFFVDLVLSKEEANAFLGVVEAIFARSPKQKVRYMICRHAAKKTGFSSDDLIELEKMFSSKFGSKLTCKAKHQSGGSQVNGEAVQAPQAPQAAQAPQATQASQAAEESQAPQAVQASQASQASPSQTKQNKAKAIGANALSIYVNNDNPIFSKDLCFAPKKVIIKTKYADGKAVKQLYDTMISNYQSNVAAIESILHRLVTKNYDGSYTLKDLDKATLDKIIADVKVKIKAFFLFSIIDFQNLLDKAKVIPNYLETELDE